MKQSRTTAPFRNDKGKIVETKQAPFKNMSSEVSYQLNIRASRHRSFFLTYDDAKSYGKHWKMQMFIFILFISF